jgi:hypothetical protein
MVLNNRKISKLVNSIKKRVKWSLSYLRNPKRLERLKRRARKKYSYQEDLSE